MNNFIVAHEVEGFEFGITADHKMYYRTKEGAWTFYKQLDVPSDHGPTPN